MSETIKKLSNLYLRIAFLVSMCLALCSCSGGLMCYTAADLGEGRVIFVDSTPGNSGLAQSVPETLQYSYWQQTDLFTNGLPKTSDTSRGILKFYMDQYWCPWGADNGNLPECTIAPVTGTFEYDGATVNIDPAQENLNETVYVDYGQAYQNYPCKINDGTGVYGLIALRQSDGSMANPNDSQYNLADFYPSDLFRIFHMRKTGSDRDGMYFQMDASYTCGDGSNLNNCQVDTSPSGNEWVMPGRLYFKVLDTYYNDNGGQVQLYPVSGVYIPSAFIEDLVNAFESTINTAQVIMSKKVSENVSFIGITRAMLMLYIAITTFCFLIGLTKFTQTELITSAVKTGFILILISPTSYEFFNFYLYSFFTLGAKQLATIINDIIIYSNDVQAETIANLLPAGAKSPFVAFDYFFRILSNVPVHAKLASLLFTQYVYFIPLMYAILGIIAITALQCILMYVVSVAYVAVLLVMAPLFISFVLFKFTSDFFSKWLDQLMSSALMVIVATAAFTLLGSMLIGKLDGIFHYRVCWDYISIPIGGTKINFSAPGLGIQIFWLKFWQPTDASQVAQAMSIMPVIQLALLATLFKAFIAQIPAMVDQLSQSSLQPLRSAYEAASGNFAQALVYPRAAIAYGVELSGKTARGVAKGANALSGGKLGRAAAPITLAVKGAAAAAKAADKTYTVLKENVYDEILNGNEVKDEKALNSSLKDTVKKFSSDQSKDE